MGLWMCRRRAVVPVDTGKLHDKRYRLFLKGKDYPEISCRFKSHDGLVLVSGPLKTAGVLK